nr:hypothetical protein [uncultured Aminipila sp.]
MIDIRGLVQSTLDNYFKGSLLAFWQKKMGDLDEYIVYTLGGDSSDFIADDTPWIKSAEVTLRYYYQDQKLETQEGRNTIKLAENNILMAMENAGFESSNGFFDAGDVDDIGFFTSVGEFNYSRVI